MVDHSYTAFIPLVVSVCQSSSSLVTWCPVPANHFTVQQCVGGAWSQLFCRHLCL